MTLENRVAKLEERLAAVEPPTIFFSVHDTVATGWLFDDADGMRVRIMRHGDETDAALTERAAAACRTARPGSVGILFQVVTGHDD